MGNSVSEIVVLLAILIFWIGGYAIAPLLFVATMGIFKNLAGITGKPFKRLSGSVMRRGREERAARQKSKNFGREQSIEQKERRYQAKNISRKAGIANMVRGSGDSRTRAFMARRVGGYNIDSLESAQQARANEELEKTIATGKDGEIRGLTAWHSYKLAEKDKDKALAQKLIETDDGTVNGNITGYRSLGGAMVSKADVLAGHKRYGDDVYAQQAAISYEFRKAADNDEVENITKNYGNLADELGMSEQRMQGTWKGVSFQNQNQHLDLKHTSWKRDPATGELKSSLNSTNFAKEVYEQRGSYQMSQMNAHTIDSLIEAFDSGDDTTKQKVQSIAETWMYRGGGQSIAGMAGEEGKEVPIPGKPGSAGFQTNTPGAAHVAENVRKLAEHVGVYQADDRDHPTSSGPFPNIEPQS